MTKLIGRNCNTDGLSNMDFPQVRLRSQLLELQVISKFSVIDSHFITLISMRILLLSQQHKSEYQQIPFHESWLYWRAAINFLARATYLV